jgi:putative transposase
VQTITPQYFPDLRETLNHHLVLLDRERAGRNASLSAAVTDSRSVTGSEAGGPRGDDAGKKVQGRKRHAVMDTGGCLLVLQCHAASVQDRDGAVPLLWASRRRFPFLLRAFADAACAASASPPRPASPSRSSGSSRGKLASLVIGAGG